MDKTKRKQDVLFLKKKNQKNFRSASRVCGTRAGSRGDKVFFASFFFKKKKTLSSYRLNVSPKYTRRTSGFATTASGVPSISTWPS